LVPFSAITTRRDRYGFTRTALRPQVFATSRQRRRPQPLVSLFHPTGTRRIMAFRVLPTVDRVPFLVLPAPSLLPCLHGIIPDLAGTCYVPDHPNLPLRASATISTRSGCITCKQVQLPSWLWANLEVFFPTASASFPSQFHPLLTLAPLLAFFPLRVFS
jgi:hypothetical protein